MPPESRVATISIPSRATFANTTGEGTRTSVSNVGPIYDRTTRRDDRFRRSDRAGIMAEEQTDARIAACCCGGDRRIWLRSLYTGPTVLGPVAAFRSAVARC